MGGVCIQAGAVPSKVLREAILAIHHRQTYNDSPPITRRQLYGARPVTLTPIAPPASISSTAPETAPTPREDDDRWRQSTHCTSP